jgi:hypothetical protein
LYSANSSLFLVSAVFNFAEWLDWFSKFDTRRCFEIYLADRDGADINSVSNWIAGKSVPFDECNTMLSQYLGLDHLSDVAMLAEASQFDSDNNGELEIDEFCAFVTHIGHQVKQMHAGGGGAGGGEATAGSSGKLRRQSMQQVLLDQNAIYMKLANQKKQFDRELQEKIDAISSSIAGAFQLDEKVLKEIITQAAY